MDHLKILVSDFNERFFDLKQIDFPSWVMQPMLVNAINISIQYQEEFSEMQKTLFSIKGAMAYPNLINFSRKLLLPFPSSYLAECGFSAVNDLLHKKRNRLDITERGDLRLKLSKLVTNIRSLCSKHQAPGSH